MERELAVFMDIERHPLPVGRLWVRDKGRGETSGFEYDPSWVKRPGAFALAPNLPLGAGLFPSSDGLFGAFTDPAPDRWGQKVMRHYERHRAKTAGTTPRDMRGMDFLVGVDDQTRLGAMRFKWPGNEEFVAKSQNPVPPLVELSKLLSAATRVERGRERRNDLDILLAPAGSLGGARPKATIRDREGQLHLAKFPWEDHDEWPVVLWEAAVLQLANDAGIAVPSFRIEQVGLKRVLLVKRFDRHDTDIRVPFVSAHTMLDAKDHETRSYLELADVLQQSGSAPQADMSQLWRRMVFNVLVSNTDDHTRNHAFLRAGAGWRLAPAYDVNPRPSHRYLRIHQMALNELDTSSSIELALGSASYFGVKTSEAKRIIGEVGAVVSTWRTIAAQFGLKKADFENMESAFEHDDLRYATSERTTVGPTTRASKKKATATPAGNKQRASAKKTSAKRSTAKQRP